MMVGNNLVAVWGSVVKVPSLSLLLGRGFLDGIGAVVSFTNQKLRPDFLDGKLQANRAFPSRCKTLRPQFGSIGLALNVFVDGVQIELLSSSCQSVIGFQRSFISHANSLMLMSAVMNI